MADFEKTTDKKLLQKQLEETYPQTIQFMDNDFVLLNNNVFSPKHFPEGEFFVNNLPAKQGQSLLEIGCGSGAFSVMACKKYNLSRVLCTDINPDAVNNTKANIELHKLTDKMHAIESDVFSKINQKEKFDLIFWNTPWELEDVPGPELIHRAFFDKDFECTKKYLAESKKWLNPNGRVFIGFSSDIGPLKSLQDCFNKTNLKMKIHHQEDFHAGDQSNLKLEMIEALQNKHHL